MAILVVLGALLIVAGRLIDDHRRFVIDRLTSRSLGSLAPGYASTLDGMRVYAVLVICVGVAVGGIGLASWFAPMGAAAAACGLFGFAVFSVVAIIGEVRTYRELKR